MVETRSRSSLSGRKTSLNRRRSSPTGQTTLSTPSRGRSRSSSRGRGKRESRSPATESTPPSHTSDKENTAPPIPSLVPNLSPDTDESLFSSDTADQAKTRPEPVSSPHNSNSPEDKTESPETNFTGATTPVLSNQDITQRLTEKNETRRGNKSRPQIPPIEETQTQDSNVESPLSSTVELESTPYQQNLTRNEGLPPTPPHTPPREPQKTNEDTNGQDTDPENHIINPNLQSPTTRKMSVDNSITNSSRINITPIPTSDTSTQSLDKQYKKFRIFLGVV